ncbi:MAG: hypothetical protein ACREKL_00620 [Chthoniobacterales bacterium]
MSKTVPRSLEFCVVSAGGVATTQLLKHFRERHIVNCHKDGDNLKHLPVPAVSFNPAFRYIYIFGDPVPSVISLFRRGFHVLQARKLHRGDSGPQPELRMTIKEFAAGGRDLFGFERHFDNYYERHLIHPTLFVRYDALWENLDAIRDFLGCAADEFAGFAPRCQRSEERVPSPHVQRQLRAIYQPFNDRLAALPDAFVRGEGLSRRRGHLLFSANLRLAALNALKSRLRPAGALYGE